LAGRIVGGGTFKSAFVRPNKSSDVLVGGPSGTIFPTAEGRGLRLAHIHRRRVATLPTGIVQNPFYGR
jgi:hypothetical protein